MWRSEVSSFKGKKSGQQSSFQKIWKILLWFLSKNLRPVESCPQNSTTEVTLMYILRKHKSGFIRNLEIEFPSKYETFQPFRKAITFDGVCFHQIESMIPDEALNFMKAHLNNFCSKFFLHWCKHLGILMATSKRGRPHCAIFCE